MKDFQAKHIVAQNSRPTTVTTTADTATQPAAPKGNRHQRRGNAAFSKHLNRQMRKASELGAPISLRQNGKGVLEVVKAKKKVDPNPQPGEVISSVEGNAMPQLPEGLDVSMSAHVHDASCEHAEPEIVVNDEMKAELDRIAKMDLFEAADELVESVVGR